MRADRMAGRDLPEAVRLAWNEQAWIKAHGGAWWDDVGTRLEAVGANRTDTPRGLVRYLAARRAGAPDYQAPPGNASEGLPWDTWIWTRTKEKDWTLLPFRLKLWWGHLLPYNARHEPTCRYCGTEVTDMHGHILGECSHEAIVAGHPERKRPEGV